jgi:hypothetical protein
MKIWRNCQRLSERTSDSSAFLNAMCLLKYILNCVQNFSFFAFRTGLILSGLVRISYIHCHEFMAPWPIITGSGLNDWIFRAFFYRKTLSTINYNSSQSIFRRTLLPWLPRTPLHSRSHSMTDFWVWVRGRVSQILIYFSTGGLPPISSSLRRDPWDSRPVILFSNLTLAVTVLM